MNIQELNEGLLYQLNYNVNTPKLEKLVTRINKFNSDKIIGCLDITIKLQLLQNKNFYMQFIKNCEDGEILGGEEIDSSILKTNTKLINFLLSKNLMRSKDDKIKAKLQVQSNTIILKIFFSLLEDEKYVLLDGRNQRVKKAKGKIGKIFESKYPHKYILNIQKLKSVNGMNLYSACFGHANNVKLFKLDNNEIQALTIERLANLLKS